jgi:hypothetical protein
LRSESQRSTQASSRSRALDDAADGPGDTVGEPAGDGDGDDSDRLMVAFSFGHASSVPASMSGTSGARGLTYWFSP